MPVKFEYVGLTDLYRQIQKSLTGGDMQALQREQLDVAREGNARLDRIAQNTERIANREPPPGLDVA
jgi:hypothetical protein